MTDIKALARQMREDLTPGSPSDAWTQQEVYVFVAPLIDAILADDNTADLPKMSNTSFDLGHGASYVMDEENGIVTTTFPSGVQAIGKATFTDEDAARAKSLGYKDEDAVLKMHMEHDLIHHLVGQAAGFNWSNVLYYIAHGLEFHAGKAAWEERMVFLVTRAMNEGRAILPQRVPDA